MAMVSLINISCPHCNRENAVLEVEGETYQSLKGTHALMAICRSCSGGVIAEVEPYNQIQRKGFLGYSREYQRDILLDCRPLYSNEFGRVQCTYPLAVGFDAPNATPERVGKFFIEAQENFSRGNYETCGALCRKVIDLATKQMALAEDISAWKLQKRMEQLKAKGAITQEMYNWADIVRLDGNEQTHSEDEFDGHSAKAVLDFTETFLLYAFTLPAMVQAKRAESEE
ncbi:DUF4145 domain-containing protein [Citrobacter amalonaticus]|uniref:DUF4145 domain-containing protein n=1 Tax=Citrobacter amalonaticus TaxID=35703 RepID=UPI00164F9128|nr:DUF4145 domain-containing protein [Citrobacter amalonaticus]MBC6535422.1 DUF4145 domain-containing protein [Citrobacter amalonaticus]